MTLAEAMPAKNGAYRNYTKVAEFYPLSLQSFSRSEQMFRQELGRLGTIGGPVLDIGSGTGRTVLAIAETLPEVEIIAVEPSTTMRAVLMHRVMQDRDLRQRVTIYSDPIHAVPLPEKLSVIVAYGVLGHFDQEERQLLWRRLIPKLEAGAPMFVELLPIGKSVDFEQKLVEGEQIGRRSYEAVYSGKAERGDLMRIKARWRISGGGGPPCVIENTNFWHTFTLEELAQETGLKLQRLTPESGILFP
ncbi:MAG: class I SAM-dependent methyltransferase [Desulfobulbus sp.]|jgi:SAM-dependent methyltransferase|uniref:class I SAM-dependent methyltransferase n=1 Tax=Desulfobulbus sp. TaxID=895 RepID=UPI00283C4A11|nr:class I SAM-dependent methyltransferase [Desulfobulbus sp.]MDR2549247.1 class I SAM-dependent methyltransferase [Desulfobulbus sp.]